MGEKKTAMDGMRELCGDGVFTVLTQALQIKASGAGLLPVHEYLDSIPADAADQLKAKDAEITRLLGNITGLEMTWAEDMQKKDGEIERLRGSLANAAPDSLYAHHQEQRAEKAEARVKEMEAGAEKAELVARANAIEFQSVLAERDLYQSCCTRAFDKWLELHPDVEKHPDGAVQIVEIMEKAEAALKLAKGEE